MKKTIQIHTHILQEEQGIKKRFKKKIKIPQFLVASNGRLQETEVGTNSVVLFLICLFLHKTLTILLNF